MFKNILHVNLYRWFDNVMLIGFKDQLDPTTILGNESICSEYRTLAVFTLGWANSLKNNFESKAPWNQSNQKGSETSWDLFLLFGEDLPCLHSSAFGSAPLMESERSRADLFLFWGKTQGGHHRRTLTRLFSANTWARECGAAKAGEAVASCWPRHPCFHDQDTRTYLDSTRRTMPASRMKTVSAFFDISSPSVLFLGRLWLFPSDVPLDCPTQIFVICVYFPTPWWYLCVHPSSCLSHVRTILYKWLFPFLCVLNSGIFSRS